ncbi:hypothetical protein [Vreelandella aquamarina]|uniref:hypothetical protein n=1 Tax=Vreelandella aquamarina TaxID=77097 RepID=UPI001115176C|nr:hypothetical protein [Halomonas meridiana]
MSRRPSGTPSLFTAHALLARGQWLKRAGVAKFAGRLAVLALWAFGLLVGLARHATPPAGAM